jgi:alpha-beta hydrolase superfamily lysophospholipase
MNEQGQMFRDTDGVEVFFRTWAANGPPRASVVIAHGASEHSGRYARFAAALNDAGCTVLAPDHRGHGRTAASTGRGVIGSRGLDGILDDLGDVIDRARAHTAPVVLIGHSMGSVLALRYAQLHPKALSALVLTGPIGVLPGVDQSLEALQQALDADLATTPMDALAAFNASFEPARTPFDWLSRDDAEVDAYLTDAYCGPNLALTYGYVHAIMAAVKATAEQVAQLGELPVLLMAGERDPASAFTAQVRELANRMRTAGVNVDETYYPNARHEILNELNRDQVQHDIINWLDHHP